MVWYFVANAMKFKHFRQALRVWEVFGAAVECLCLCEGVCGQVMWPWPEGHWKPSVPFSSPDIPSILPATSPAVNSEKQRAGSLAGLLGTLLRMDFFRLHAGSASWARTYCFGIITRTLKLVSDQQINQMSRQFHSIPKTGAGKMISFSRQHWPLLATISRRDQGGQL